MKSPEQIISDRIILKIGQELLKSSTECVCRPIRRNSVEVSKIKEIFAKVGVELIEEIPF